MKILYLAYYYLPHVGGGTWSTFNLAHQLARRHELHLLVPRVQYTLTANQFDGTPGVALKSPVVHLTPCVRLPASLGPLHLLGHLLAMPFLFLSGIRIGRGSDAVVCQYHPHHLVFVVGVLLGRILKVPVIGRADDVYRPMMPSVQTKEEELNQFIAKTVNIFNELAVPRASVLLCTCSEQRLMLESRVGKLSNISLSPNGVDMPLPEDTDQAEAKSSLNIPRSRKVILFLGRFTGREYRVDVLVASFATLRTFFGEATLFLVGDSTGFKIDSSLSKNITVVGPIPHSEVRRYLAAADVCVGPMGPTCTIPLKILEYMAWGKPIVTGIGSVSKDLAKDGFNCLCVPPDAEALSEAIATLLEDTRCRVRISSNARTTATKFAWSRISQELEATIYRCAKKRAVAS